MNNSLFLIIFKELFINRLSLRFFIGVILSLSFSMAVILGTIGLMDGFEESLKLGLKKSNGDVSLSNHYGFFDFDQDRQEIFQKNGFDLYSAYVQSEGFVVANSQSKGVVVRGIPENFATVAKLEIDVEQLGEGVALGKELAKTLNVQVGDRITLAIGQGDQGFQSLPQLIQLEVKAMVSHGIYENDMRLIYLPLKRLDQFLSLFGKVNIVTFNLHSRIGPDVRASDYIDKVKNQIALFPSPSDLLGAGFRLRPFWKDFQHIIDAVEVEKNTILLILQIIVVVAIFNVLAFMIFLSEKKSQEIFLFQALGAQRRHLNRAWFVLTFFIWMASTGMSVVLVEIFDLSLQHFSFFQLPGDIYNLESLYLKLSPGHYVLVSGLAFLWMIIISSIGFYRQNRKSLLSGLRREFA